MADRYWVPVAGVGSGNFSDTAHWSGVSGGAGGSSAPAGGVDNAFFDANSSTTAYTVTNVAGINVLDFKVLAQPSVSGVMTFAANGQGVNIAGSFALLPGCLWTNANANVAFTATAAGKTIDPQGVTFPLTTFTFSGAGGGWTWISGATLANDFVMSSAGGNLNINGQTISARQIAFSGTNTVTLGAATLNMTGSAQTFSVAATVTWSAATSTINCTNGDFNGGGQSFGTVVLNMIASHTLTGNNTYVNLTIFLNTATKGLAYALAGNQTVTGAFKALGNSAVNRLRVSSSVGGTQRTITRAADDATCNFVNFSDINFAGAAGAFATGNSLGDCLGNTNFTATPSAAQSSSPAGTASFAWSDPTKWTSRVPLPQDDVTVPNAFVAGRTVNADMPDLGRSITFTCTGSPALSFGIVCNIYGSISLAAGMTTSGGNVKNFCGRGSHTIQSNVVTWSGGMFMLPGTGTYTLIDAIVTASNLQFSGGTFTDGGFAVTAQSFNMFGTTTINKTGDWTITVTSWSIGSGTFNDTGGVLKFTDATASTKTFTGGGKTYNNVWFSGVGTGVYQISGANTFNQFKADANRNIQFTAATNNTAADWAIATGCTLGSITAAGHTLTKSGGGKVKLQGITVSRSTGLPIGTFYAFNGSTDGGNNVNWRFYNPDYALACDTGAFAFVGTAASLTAQHLIRGAAGAFIFVGQAASFLRPLFLRGDTGAFTFNGNDAILLALSPDPNFVVSDHREFTVSDDRDFTVREQ